MAAPATPPESMPRRRWLRWLGYALGAGAALIAIAWLIVPPIARSQIETRLSDALGRPTTVEAVDFDPFQLRLTVRKLAIADSPRPTAAADGRRAGRRPVPGVDLASRAGARCAEGRAAERGARARARRALQRAGPHRSGGGRSAWPARPAVAQQHRGRRRRDRRSTTASPGAGTRSRRSMSAYRSSRRCPTIPTSASSRG